MPVGCARVVGMLVEKERARSGKRSVFECMLRAKVGGWSPGSISVEGGPMILY